jgi:hypothetical protein
MLGLVSVVMLYESTRRMFRPVDISFDEAIFIAVIGLVVNGLSVWILRDKHEHHHEHEHEHTHHHDHNLRAAYFHVLADALTSVLAIAALLGGKYYGWNWLDPAMGIVGAVPLGNRSDHGFSAGAAGSTGPGFVLERDSFGPGIRWTNTSHRPVYLEHRSGGLRRCDFT